MWLIWKRTNPFIKVILSENGFLFFFLFIVNELFQLKLITEIAFLGSFSVKRKKICSIRRESKNLEKFHLISTIPSSKARTARGRAIKREMILSTDRTGKRKMCFPMAGSDRATRKRRRVTYTVRIFRNVTHGYQ